MARVLHSWGMTINREISVLLIAEDPLLVAPVAEFLQLKGMHVTIETEVNSPDVRKHLDNQMYDVSVVNTARSNAWALETIEALRVISSVPIIAAMRDAEKDTMIAGYEQGADEVQNLPIPTELLICKIESIVRRMHMDEKQTEYPLGELTFYVDKQVLVAPNGEILHRLSGKENDVLELLASHINTTVEKSVILRKIWKADNYFNGRSLAVYINKLRSKLETEQGIRLITVQGKGYKLCGKE